MNKDLPQVIDESLPEPEIKTQKYRNLSPLVADMLAHGSGVEGTAAKFGLSRNTVYRWLETDHFQALVELKKTEYRLELLKTIQKAGQKPHLWAAAAWCLERNKVFGDEFKLNQGSKGTGQVVVQIAINHPAMQQVASELENEG
jgi:hypothetical protein